MAACAKEQAKIWAEAAIEASKQKAAGTKEGEKEAPVVMDKEFIQVF